MNRSMPRGVHPTILALSRERRESHVSLRHQPRRAALRSAAPCYAASSSGRLLGLQKSLNSLPLLFGKRMPGTVHPRKVASDNRRT